MLYEPQEIRGQRSYRDYAIDVYRTLLSNAGCANRSSQLQTAATRFGDSFRHQTDATKCSEHVIGRIKSSMEDSETEENFFLLPPLFFRSKTTALVHLEDTNINLFFCECGPIVPVLMCKSNYVMHDDRFLMNHIIRIYKGTSNQYLDRYNLHTLLLQD